MHTRTLAHTLATPAADLAKLDAVRGAGSAAVVWIGFALDRGELVPRAPQAAGKRRGTADADGPRQSRARWSPWLWRIGAAPRALLRYFVAR